MTKTSARPSKDEAFCNHLVFLYEEEDLPISCVAEKLGISLDTVYSILRKRGIKTRRKRKGGTPRADLRADFFKTIDNEKKAYFLGLWYADGSISCNRRGSYSSSIGLSKPDSYLLRELSELIYAKPKPICFFGGSVSKRKNGRIVKNNPMGYFYVYGKDFYDALNEKGCVPHKTFYLRFPTSDQVPHHLLHHFVRGFFDGDGCICFPAKGYKDGSKRGLVSFVSTKQFLTGLSDYLSQCGLTMKVRPKSSVYTISTSRRDVIVKLGKLMYQDATTFLTRKQEKFKELRAI